MIGRDFNLFETPGASANPFAQVVNRAVAKTPQIELSKIPNAPLIATKDWKGELATTVPGTQGFGALGGGRIATEPEIEKINAFAEAIKMDNPEYSVLPPEKNKGLVEAFIQDNPEYSSIFQSKEPEQSFLGGLADKTKESFMSGVNRIGEAGVGLEGGKYDVGEAGIRVAVGALESAWSPVAGVLGQGIESFVPDSVKESVGGTLAPVIEKGSEIYSNLSPEAQRLVDNLLLVGEVGLNFLGVGAATKGAGALKGVTKTTLSKVDDVVGKAAEIAKNRADKALISKVGQKTAKGVIGGVIVDVPVPKKSITSKVISTVSRSDDPVVLAGRAVAPRSVGKTDKQIVNTFKNTEKRTQELHSLVRRGKIQGDLTDLTTTAETVVNGLDNIGAKIGKSIKSAKGTVGQLPEELNLEIGDILTNEVQKRAVAHKVLTDFVEVTQKGLSVQDAFAAKKIFSQEIGKLIKAGDAGTDSYSALVKGVEELSNQIDSVVAKSSGGSGFKELKKQYKLLKELSGDIVRSAQVEARRSPMTLTEQVGTIRGIVSAVSNPIDAATSALAKEIGEMNTRGGTWQRLINLYDERAIKGMKSKIVKPNPSRLVREPIISKVGGIAKKLDMSKNKKGFINPGKIAEDLGATKANNSTKALMEEARKYKSAEEFVKAQETLYHGTQAVKIRDYSGIENKMKEIYKKLGQEYKESDSAKIVSNAEELVSKKSNEKLSKVQSQIDDLQELLSRRISKPSSKFAGLSNKDVTDNSLGSFLTPDRDFATRFTYDISYDYSGRKTIHQKNGYLLENYFSGKTLDLSKVSSPDLDFISKILGMNKNDIVLKLKTKGGTKEIQKKLAPKKDIISKEYDAVSNYAYDDQAKKWKKEIAVINDKTLYTKSELTNIYNKSKK